MSDEEFEQLWGRTSEFTIINSENATERYGMHVGHNTGYAAFTVALRASGGYVLEYAVRTYKDKCSYVCVKDY